MYIPDNRGLARNGLQAPKGNVPPRSSLIIRSVFVVLTNMVVLDGVIRLGWNAVPLVLMFILEGVAVLVTDFVKYFFDKDKPKIRTIFVIECGFILFYGFFASLVFGPYASLQAAVDDGFRLQRTMIAGELLTPLAGLFFMRLVRLGHDLVDSGAFGGKVRRKLQLDGGGWMFLLFFAVMLAPLVARSGPNPTGGLVALVILKTLGELLGVWASRIEKWIPKPGVKNAKR
ncbi:MAG: hypothetical protein HY892_02770 [Deltaproteobacteria bacterium]|nr:hypothetical protein [Deltaproteobacteria bacterium]